MLQNFSGPTLILLGLVVIAAIVVIIVLAVRASNKKHTMTPEQFAQQQTQQAYEAGLRQAELQRAYEAGLNATPNTTSEPNQNGQH